jgi:hypothetical protein
MASVNIDNRFDTNNDDYRFFSLVNFRRSRFCHIYAIADDINNQRHEQTILIKLIKY